MTDETELFQSWGSGGSFEPLAAPSRHSTVIEARALHEDRVVRGDNIPASYAKAAMNELEELEAAETSQEREDEYGDVLANVLALGAAWKFEDPLALAQRSLNKVKRRRAYIWVKISKSPGEEGFAKEYERLWQESKLADSVVGLTKASHEHMQERVRAEVVPLSRAQELHSDLHFVNVELLVGEIDDIPEGCFGTMDNTYWCLASAYYGEWEWGLWVNGRCRSSQKPVEVPMTPDPSDDRVVSVNPHMVARPAADCLEQISDALTAAVDVQEGPQTAAELSCQSFTVTNALLGENLPTHDNWKAVKSTEEARLVKWKWLIDVELIKMREAPIEETLDRAVTLDLLWLVDVAVTPVEVASWTPTQIVEAEAWAGAVHASASDNDDVEVPPRPEFLPDRPVPQDGIWPDVSGKDG